MKSVPAGWYDYSRYGDVVTDTFIPLKVPLSRNKISIGPNEQFTPQDVVNQINLGLIVDLTNTARYYNPCEFITNGVEYVKIPVMGKVVPENHLVQRFIGVVKRYLGDSNTEGKLIGVHCTHGLNRTGYFICAYMIQELGYDPMEAIRLFNAKRGHKMERDNYLQSLRKMEPSKRQKTAESRNIHARANYRDSWRRTRVDRVPRTQDSAEWRQNRSSVASRRYDDVPTRANGDHHHKRYTTPEHSEMIWDHQVRRIVRTHNFRVPSYRSGNANEKGTHLKFE